jgi:hypothetical protein
MLPLFFVYYLSLEYFTFQNYENSGKDFISGISSLALISKSVPSNLLNHGVSQSFARKYTVNGLCTFVPLCLYAIAPSHRHAINVIYISFLSQFNLLNLNPSKRIY